MNNKFGLLCSALLLASSAYAQTEVPMDMYVPLFRSGEWYDSQNFESWEPGQNPEENFFISRVRPRERFVNENTQVYPAEDAKGKKVLWWMPVSNGDWTLNLPSYTMRNDIFSLWSYLDVHGGWNQPMLRSSGTFGDVCHKNGVRNSVLMFFDSGSTIDYTNPSKNAPSKFFATLFKEEGGKYVNAERLVKMFRYYGISGWSINPEVSMTQATAEKLQDFIVACREAAESLGWGEQWNLCWYDSMLNSGGVSFSMNTLYTSNQNWFAYRMDKTKQVADHFFLNYNHGSGQINNAVKTAKSLGHSSFDVYTGQHIGTRGLGDSWQYIMENDISIGTWGEHSQNNIFYNSTDKGSAPEVQSQVYTEKLEMFFSGGNRNPKNAPEYITSRGDLSYSNMQNFNGVATKVVAQSTLSELPFVTYFSLGNGLCNYEKGEKFSDFQWYNLGMQDFMPTWRWWVVDDNGNVPADAIKCDISYDEAYMGANSLKFSGKTAKSNIRLFKTQFAVKGTEKVSLVYKVKEGTNAKMKLTYSLKGSESQFKTIAVPVSSKEGEWSTATWTLSDWGINNGDVIACLGATIENTDEKYAVYVGGLSIIDPAKTYSPVKPAIITDGYEMQMNRSAYNYETIKLIWKAKENQDPWINVYNDEVDTWYYEVMVREDGGEPKMVNRTTSWAAVTAVQLTATSKTFEMGVRAVAPDGVTRSDIAWLDKKFEHKYEYKTGIVFDGRKIVPNEEFTIALEDPTIPTAHWVLTSDNGAAVKEMDGKSITASCPSVGLYNLSVSFDNPSPENPDAVYEKTYNGLIVVTPEATGRFPKADFTFNDQIDISGGAQEVTFNFSGIKGEGYTSNAIDLTDGTHFFAADPAVLGRPSTLTMAAWVKPTNLAGQVMSLRDLGTNPSWGSTWIYLEREKTTNQVQFCLMGRDRGADFKDMFSGVEVKIGTWYHIAMVLDRDNKEVRLYVNGKRVNTQSVSFKSSYDLYSLGTEGFQGSIDEVQYWNKALTDEEMAVAMYGYTLDKVPAGLQGYWIFEDKCSDNGKKFPNLGKAGNEFPGGVFKGTSMKDNDNLTPSIVSGSTWLSGNTKVETTLTWDFKGASKVDLSNIEAPVVTYDKEGEYPATLTVENAYGKDVKEVTVKVDKGGVGIINTEKAYVTISPTVFTDNVTIELIDAGIYTVNVYDSKGMLVKSLRKNCVDNETVHVDLNVSSGIYLVKVAKDEMILKAAKIVKR